MINYNLQCIYCGARGKMEMAAWTLHGLSSLRLPVFGILDKVTNVFAVHVIAVSIDPKMTSVLLSLF